MKSRKMRVEGFTLTEIMIVVALIGLLAAIAVPNWVHARTTSQNNACINNLREICGATQQWALDNRHAPERKRHTQGGPAVPEECGCLPGGRRHRDLRKQLHPEYCCRPPPLPDGPIRTHSASGYHQLARLAPGGGQPGLRRNSLGRFLLEQGCRRGRFENGIVSRRRQSADFSCAEQMSADCRRRLRFA